MMKRGRKSQYTPEQIRQWGEYIQETRCSYAAAAEHFGVPSVLIRYHMLKNLPEVAPEVWAELEEMLTPKKRKTA